MAINIQHRMEELNADPSYFSTTERAQNQSRKWQIVSPECPYHSSEIL